MNTLRCTLILLLLWAGAAGAQTNFHVLVNSRAQHAVLRFDAEGNYLFPFIEAATGGLNYPEDILLHPDGSVLVTGFGNTAIKRYNGTTGIYRGEFSSGYSLNGPSKMSIGPDSLIYVTEWMVDHVVRFDLQGDYVDIYIDSGAVKGLGHVWDAAGNFYLSVFNDGLNGEVRKYDPSGNFLGVFASTSALQGPTNLWFDHQGDLLVEDWSTGKVLRYDNQGNYQGEFITTMANPEGIAFLPNGDFLIGDWGLDVVHRFDSNGTPLGNFVDAGLVSDPNCVRILPVEDTTTAIAETRKNAPALTVWPVAGADVFHIGLREPFSGRILIYDFMGRCVHTLVCDNQRSLQWNASHMAAGTYFIHAQLPGSNVPKVVVTR